MEKQVINQENQNQMKNRNNSNTRTNAAVRRLLASSALSTAIISWIATAQGLHKYVFSYYWQAAIISAAIQGTLFAFSIKAIPLMKRLGIMGKVAMGILWICILLSSSIFSFVYISKSVYSDKLLQDDSNRIMATRYIEIYSLLDGVIENEKEIIEDKRGNYIKLLAKDDGTIEISEDDKKDLNRIKESIEDYVSKNVIVLLNNLQLGNYSENDMQTLNEMLDNEIKNNDIQIENIQQQIERENDKVLPIEGRLESFSNTNSEDYRNLTDQLDKIQIQIENLQKDLDVLYSCRRNLEECQTKIKYIEGGLERKLYNEILELRNYLNQDKIDTDSIIAVVEEIHDNLYSYNLSSSDQRLAGYKDFKNNITLYVTLTDKQEIISIDREKVYAIVSNTKDMSEEDTQESEEDTQGSEEIDYSWGEISSNLQNILKDIPQSYFDNFILNHENENQSYLSSNEIIELVMDMDRLYLSDLNDFERAWTLLWSDIHTYKTLLWFSVIFAFGMDLFSFGTGLLLYFMDNEKEMDTSHKHLCWKKIVRVIRFMRKHRKKIYM